MSEDKETYKPSEETETELRNQLVEAAQHNRWDEYHQIGVKLCALLLSKPAPVIVIRFTGEHTGFCRAFYKNVKTKRVYCTVPQHVWDDKENKYVERKVLHSFYHEPDCPLREDIVVVELDSNNQFKRRWIGNIVPNE